MMRFLFIAALSQALQTSRASFLAAADPMCRSGVVSADLYACCPKSCGACDDAHPACTGGGDKAAMEKGGCCPAVVKKGKRTCSNMSPPCKLTDDYRNPPNADALDILANTERHAKDDCGDAKGAHAKEMRVATHFVHKTGIKVTEPGFDCGTYAEIDAAAEACRVKEDCVAFGLKGGKPDCLLSSFGLTSNDKDSELYIKVKNQAGANLVDGQRRFQAPSDQTDAVEGAKHAADVAADVAKMVGSKAEMLATPDAEAAATSATDAAAKAADEAAAAAAAPDASGAVASEEAAMAAEAEAATASVGLDITTALFSKGSFGELEITKDKFNELARKTGVLRRVCDDCAADYQNIVYVRLTGIDTFDYYENMLIVWSDTDNKMGTDFNLYSTMDDARAGANPWNFCNYNDYGAQIGFPRDCGPTRATGWQWNSFKHSGTRQNYVYYVEPALDCAYTHTANAAISGHNKEKLTEVSVDDCKAACSDTSWCVSFDYYKNSQKCDLSDKRAEDVGGLKTTYNNDPYDHYSLSPGCPGH